MSKSVLPLVLLTAIVFHYGYAEAKSTAEVEEEKRDEMRKKIEEKKADLNGSSWQILIKSQGGKGGLDGSDTLTFQDGKFSSATLSKKNYNPTNYTLTIQEGGPTIWETMQTSEKDGVTFWRGEWLKDSMNGVITRQIEKGSEDYYFSSSAMKRIPPTSPKNEEEQGAPAVEAASPIAPNSVFVSKGTETEEPIKAAETKKPKEKTSWFF